MFASNAPPGSQAARIPASWGSTLLIGFPPMPQLSESAIALRAGVRSKSRWPEEERASEQASKRASEVASCLGGEINKNSRRGVREGPGDACFRLLHLGVRARASVGLDVDVKPLNGQSSDHRALHM